jgi:hypothetical protein
LVRKLGKKDRRDREEDRLHVAGGGKETSFPRIENASVYVTGCL